MKRWKQPMERAYSSADQMWRMALQQVYEYGEPVGSRDGRATELLGYHGVLQDLDRTFVTSPGRRLDSSYAGAELLWYLSGQNDVEMIQAYAPQYSRFAEHGRAWGAYGRRLLGSDLMVYQLLTKKSTHEPWAASQLQVICEVLRRHPESRQAVVSMWNDGDLPHAVLGDKADLPCTLSLQFLLRQGKLCLVTTMRSNDLWLGMPYDVYAFTSIQWLVAAALDVPTGWYCHQVGSLHLYDRDKAKAEKALEYPVPRCSQVPPHGWQRAGLAGSVWGHAQRCVTVEEALRRGQLNEQEWDEVAVTLEAKTPVTDAAACCGTRWQPLDSRRVCSPSLRQAVERRKEVQR